MSKFEEAVKLMTEADNLKEAGDVVGAVVLNRRAYRLEPTLDPCRSQQGASTTTEKDAKREDDYDKEREAEEYLEPLLHPPANSGFRTFDAAELLTTDGRRDIFMYAEEYGFVVVDNVLSADQIAEGVAEFKRFMAANEIDMDDVESVISGFGDRDLGIVSRASIGQSRFNWLARSNVFVKDAFRAVMGLPQGEGKLITSFDGCGYFVNPEIPHPNGAGYGGGPGGASLFGGIREPWYHFDAGSSDVANYFQGVVNYLDCIEDTEAGIVVLPKSHKTVFPRLFPAENKSIFKNYLSGVNGRLASKIMDLKLEERPMRVPLKAGSIVLFRSSLMHCNMGCIPRGNSSSPPTTTTTITPTVGDDDDKTAEDDENNNIIDGTDNNTVPSTNTTTANNTYRPSQILRRLVSYVCMIEDPHDAALTNQRKEYFAAGKTTAHQPDVLRWVGDRFKPHLLEKGVLPPR